MVRNMEPHVEHGHEVAEANVLWFCTEACRFGYLLRALLMPGAAGTSCWISNCPTDVVRAKCIRHRLTPVSSLQVGYVIA